MLYARRKWEKMTAGDAGPRPCYGFSLFNHSVKLIVEQIEDITVIWSLLYRALWRSFLLLGRLAGGSFSSGPHGPAVKTQPITLQRNAAWVASVGEYPSLDKPVFQSERRAARVGDIFRSLACFFAGIIGSSSHEGN